MARYRRYHHRFRNKRITAIGVCSEERDIVRARRLINIGGMRGERSIPIAKEPDITHTDGILREVSKVRGPSHTHGIRNEVYRRHGINRHILGNLVGASHAISDDEGYTILRPKLS